MTASIKLLHCLLHLSLMKEKFCFWKIVFIDECDFSGNFVLCSPRGYFAIVRFQYGVTSACTISLGAHQSCTVSETGRLLPTQLSFTPHSGWTRSNFVMNFIWQNVEFSGYPSCVILIQCQCVTLDRQTYMSTVKTVTALAQLAMLPRCQRSKKAKGQILSSL